MYIYIITHNDTTTKHDEESAKAKIVGWNGDERAAAHLMYIARQCGESYNDTWDIHIRYTA